MGIYLRSVFKPQVKLRDYSLILERLRQQKFCPDLNGLDLSQGFEQYKGLQEWRVFSLYPPDVVPQKLEVCTFDMVLEGFNVEFFESFVCVSSLKPWNRSFLISEKYRQAHRYNMKALLEVFESTGSPVIHLTDDRLSIIMDHFPDDKLKELNFDAWLERYHQHYEDWVIYSPELPFNTCRFSDANGRDYNSKYEYQTIYDLLEDIELS